MPNIMESLFGREPESSEADEAVAAAAQLATKELSPFVIERFQDPILFSALKEIVKGDPKLLVEYLENCSQLEIELNKDRFARGEGKVLGEEVELPESVHSDGRTRRAESGARINLEEITRRGIDPSKVLFFRVTQPTIEPKPEYYWTTDFRETQRGLNVEISEEKRQTAVTLIADLATVAGEKGLIQDINDDNGLAVRQISMEPFDQARCLAVILPHEPPASSAPPSFQF